MPKTNFVVASIQNKEPVRALAHCRHWQGGGLSFHCYNMGLEEIVHVQVFRNLNTQTTVPASPLCITQPLQEAKSPQRVSKEEGAAVTGGYP